MFEVCIMKGYKVVYEELKRYFSVWTYHGEIEYKIGEKTVPLDKCGPLAVFDTYKNAKKFGYSNVFECEYELSKHKTMWNSRGHLLKSSFPKGTILADSVTLIKKVKI